MLVCERNFLDLLFFFNNALGAAILLICQYVGWHWTLVLLRRSNDISGVFNVPLGILFPRAIDEHVNRSFYMDEFFHILHHILLQLLHRSAHLVLFNYDVFQFFFEPVLWIPNVLLFHEVKSVGTCMLKFENLFGDLLQLFNAHVEIINTFSMFIKTAVAHPLGFCAEVSLPGFCLKISHFIRKLQHCVQ